MYFLLPMNFEFAKQMDLQGNFSDFQVPLQLWTELLIRFTILALLIGLAGCGGRGAFTRVESAPRRNPIRFCAPSLRSRTHRRRLRD